MTNFRLLFAILGSIRIKKRFHIVHSRVHLSNGKAALACIVVRMTTECQAYMFNYAGQQTCAMVFIDGERITSFMDFPCFVVVVVVASIAISIKRGALSATH